MNDGEEQGTKSDSDQSSKVDLSQVGSSNASPTTDIIDNISSFMIGLKSQKQSSWKPHWNIFEQQDGVCFYRLSRDKYFRNVTMSFKILVNNDMKMTMYKNEVEADHSELNWILKHSQLEHWSQFHRLMEYYQQEPRIKLRSDPVRPQHHPVNTRPISPARRDQPYQKYEHMTVPFGRYGAPTALCYHDEEPRRKRTRRSKKERMRLKQNLIDQNSRE